MRVTLRVLGGHSTIQVAIPDEPKQVSFWYSSQEKWRPGTIKYDNAICWKYIWWCYAPSPVVSLKAHAVRLHACDFQLNRTDIIGLIYI